MAITVLMAIFVSYVTLDKGLAEKITLFHLTKSDEEYVSKEMKKTETAFVLLIVCGLSVVSAVLVEMRGTELLNQIKLSIALVCLAGAACNDYRERRIPNIFPLVLAVSGIVCLATGYLVDQDGAMAYVASCLIATVGVTLCLTIASVLTKQGIGFGDIKLLGALSLIGGVYVICGTLFFGMVLCCGLAIVLLVAKKKKLADSLPFGPFIFLGFIATIILEIY